MKRKPKQVMRYAILIVTALAALPTQAGMFDPTSELDTSQVQFAPEITQYNQGPMWTDG